MSGSCSSPAWPPFSEPSACSARPPADVRHVPACHALDRAGTAGTVGPDLDAAFRRARADGLGADTIAGVVEQQILHPGPRSRMPAALVTGEDAENVAAYVAHAAAVPGEDRGRLGDVD